MAKVWLRISVDDMTDEGWEETTSLLGNDYWYKFTGGTQGKGNQKFAANGVSKSFNVQLKGPSNANYRLSEPLVTFNDLEYQLSGSLNGNKMRVNDACTESSKGMIYAVWVHPVGDEDDLFQCHPRVSNQ